MLGAMTAVRIQGSKYRIEMNKSQSGEHGGLVVSSG